MCVVKATTRRSAAGITVPKQARGWALKQVTPGVLAWTTPSGCHYVV